MEIEKTQLEQIIAQAANPDRLEPDQIPELDLYIDQILMLFEDKLGDNRRHEKDKILTKSMVNNYSKERMIRPMRGKKYTREQILQILLICSLKNMLSIGDIKRLMTALMEEGVGSGPGGNLPERPRQPAVAPAGCRGYYSAFAF